MRGRGPTWRIPHFPHIGEAAAGSEVAGFLAGASAAGGSSKKPAEIAPANPAAPSCVLSTQASLDAAVT